MASLPTSATLAQEVIAETISSSPSSPLLSATIPSSESDKTVLYLAYGSNLCAKTFLDRRGIKPLSSRVVHVPTLNLSFNLPGVPYIEPCMANTTYRDPSAPPPPKSPYHKDRWQKGLIGVVYEVTIEDYKTIIATEGGGSSYNDVLVECFNLPSGAESLEVGLEREGRKTFKAHTLLAPAKRKRIQPRDSSYAQPSARYLGLITSGADEHSLPEDYKTYLREIRPYTITTYRQQLGRMILYLWVPWFLIFLPLARLFEDKEGKLPAWLSAVFRMMFESMWAVYDVVLRRLFGDGERTIEEDGHGAISLVDEDVEKACSFRSEGSSFWCEKAIVGVEDVSRT